MFRLLTAAVALGLLAAAAACGDGEVGPAPRTERELPAPEVITFTAAHGAFRTDQAITAGPVVVAVRNELDGPVFPALGRLNDDVTQDDVMKAFAKGPDAVLPLLTVAGNVPPVEPGEEERVTIELVEGAYLMVDPEAEPPPIGFFVVEPATGKEVGTPDPEWTITTGDYYFEIPDPTAGETTVAIANEGGQSHEVIITHKDGAEDAGVFYLAPYPGTTMWVPMDLEPGDYEIVCYFPDPKTGKSHAKLGMKALLTIP